MRSVEELGMDAAVGALAGVAATAVMTTLMKPGLARMLSARWRPRRWVPRQVADWLAQRIVDQPAGTAAATLAHVGYGAGAGAVYGLMRGQREGRLPRGAAPAAGAAWGLLVWAAGYEGWMPAAGVRPATTDFPASRWPLPIANHIVYGMVTAGVMERMRPEPPTARAR